LISYIFYTTFISHYAMESDLKIAVDLRLQNPYCAAENNPRVLRR